MRHCLSLTFHWPFSNHCLSLTFYCLFIASSGVRPQPALLKTPARAVDVRTHITERGADNTSFPSGCSSAGTATAYFAYCELPCLASRRRCLKFTCNADSARSSARLPARPPLQSCVSCVTEDSRGFFLLRSHSVVQLSMVAAHPAAVLLRPSVLLRALARRHTRRRRRGCLGGEDPCCTEWRAGPHRLLSSAAAFEHRGSCGDCCANARQETEEGMMGGQGDSSSAANHTTAFRSHTRTNAQRTNTVC